MAASVAPHNLDVCTNLDVCLVNGAEDLIRRCLADALDHQLVEIRRLFLQQREVLDNCSKSDLRSTKEKSSCESSAGLPPPTTLPKPSLPPNSPLHTPRAPWNCDDDGRTTFHENEGDFMQSSAGDTIVDAPSDAVKRNGQACLDDVALESASSKDRKRHSGSSSTSREKQSMSRVLGKRREDPWWGFHLDSFIAVVIVSNAAVSFVQSQYKGSLKARELGLETNVYGWSNADLGFAITEHIFNVTYMIELMVRMSYFRLRYFTEASNIFDFIIVGITSVDAYILIPIFDAQAAQNLSIARMVRVARLVRVVRIFKVFRFANNFTELRVLFLTISHCFRALFWSILMMLFLLLGAGMMINQILYGMPEESLDLETRLWIYRYYGTGARATWTMYEATFSGGWPQYVRPLLENVSGWLCIFFIVYNVIVTFAVLRIMYSIFLNETIKTAAKDKEQVVMYKMKEQEVYKQHLRDFFGETDTNHDGQVSLDELDAILGYERVLAWLSSLDIECYELKCLFSLLDDNGDGTVSLDEFLNGVMRMKGEARALDVICIMHEQNKILTQMGSVAKAVERLQRDRSAGIQRDRSAGHVRPYFPEGRSSIDLISKSSL